MAFPLNKNILSSNSLFINLISSNHHQIIDKEKYDDWPISKVNHSEPIGFDKFCILANDIQLLPHKHPMLHIKFNTKIDNILKN